MAQSNTTARASRRADGHFTTIANAAIRDPRLSWKAKGILAGALSHGPGFKFNREWFVANSTDGMAAIRSALQELREHGYLATEHYRRGEGEAFSPRLHFSDDPTLLAEEAQDGGISNVAGNQPGWKPTRSKTSHVLRRPINQEEQSEEEQVEPPLPPAGGTHTQGDYSKDVRGGEWWSERVDGEWVTVRVPPGKTVHECVQATIASGTLAAVPQPESAPSPKRNRMAKPQPFTPTTDDIPASLLPVEAPLMAFWQDKTGQRTQQAWNCLTGALERIWQHPDGGTHAVREQLENATQAG